MPLLDLAVQDFRNIAVAELRFSPQLNLITGSNGAGKTSFLEAIHFLGRAQSFRSPHPEQLIRQGSQAFLLRSHVRDAHGNVDVIGMQRHRDQLRVRMGGRRVSRLSELLPHFPFQLFTPDSHQLVEGGPSHRRKFLDWGVFHVEPAFFPAWKRYTRALKQRNAALRNGARTQEVQLWDRELAECGETVDQMRRTYLQDLLPSLQSSVTNLAGFDNLSWEYKAGWNRKLDFSQALKDCLDGDRRLGFTRSGPHRADLSPTFGGAPAYERISRGQQKQIAIAMMLAQADVYRRHTGQQCIFLIDDLASELDERHRDRVQEYLRDIQAQVFLTAIDLSFVDTRLWHKPAVFHVEHGQVQG